MNEDNLNFFRFLLHFSNLLATSSEPEGLIIHIARYFKADAGRVMLGRSPDGPFTVIETERGIDQTKNDTFENSTYNLKLTKVNAEDGREDRKWRDIREMLQRPQTFWGETSVHGPLSDGGDCFGLLMLSRIEQPFKRLEIKRFKKVCSVLSRAVVAKRDQLLLETIVSLTHEKTVVIDVYSNALRELQDWISWDHSASLLTIQREKLQYVVRSEWINQQDISIGQDLAKSGDGKTRGNSPRVGFSQKLSPTTVENLTSISRWLYFVRNDAKWTCYAEDVETGRSVASSSSRGRKFVLTDEYLPLLDQFLIADARPIEISILCVPLFVSYTAKEKKNGLGQLDKERRVLGFVRLAATYPLLQHALNHDDLFISTNLIRPLQGLTQVIERFLYSSERYMHNKLSLEALDKLSKLIAEPVTDGNELSNALLKIALDSMGLENGFVYLSPDEYATSRFLLDESANMPDVLSDLIQRCIKCNDQQKPIISRVASISISTCEDCLLSIGEGKFRSRLSNDIVVGDQRVGTIVLFSLQRNRFGRHEAEFLDQFVQHAALAIEAFRKTWEDRLISAAVAAVNSSRDWQETLEKLLMSTANAIGASHGSLSLVKWDDRLQGTGKLVIYATMGEGWTDERKSTRLRVGEGITGQAVLTGKPRLVYDTKSTPGYVEFFPKTRSELAVPMIIEDRVIGVINYDGQHLRAFSQADLNLVLKIARHASIALMLKRAKLYFRSKDEEKILNSILEVENRLSTHIEEPDILRELIGATSRVFSKEVPNVQVAFYNYDHVTKELILNPSSQELGGYTVNAPGFDQDLRLSLTTSSLVTSVAQKVFKNRDPIKPIIRNVQDVTKNSDYLKLNDETRSKIVISIVSRTQLVGVLSLECPQVDAFSSFYAERILNDIAKNTGAAIAHARGRKDVESIVALNMLGRVAETLHSAPRGAFGASSDLALLREELSDPSHLKLVDHIQEGLKSFRDKLADALRSASMSGASTTEDLNISIPMLYEKIKDTYFIQENSVILKIDGAPPLITYHVSFHS